MKRHLEKIVIYNGGTVARCDNCNMLTGLRFVNETRNMCPNSSRTWQDLTSYDLCDECADKRKKDFESEGGEIIDGRETARNPITQHAII